MAAELPAGFPCLYTDCPTCGGRLYLTDDGAPVDPAHGYWCNDCGTLWTDKQLAIATRPKLQVLIDEQNQVLLVDWRREQQASNSTNSTNSANRTSNTDSDK